MKALEPMAVALGGTTLIEASAGTGKTHTITTLVVRLLVERRLQVGEILVVTFTNAAAAELRDRIRRRLTETIWAIDGGGAIEHDPELTAWLDDRRCGRQLAADRAWLQLAVRDFDEAPICTIHAFCQRVLAEHAFESKTAFELQLVEQQEPLLEEIAFDYWGNITYQAPLDLVRALRGKITPENLVSLAAKVMRDPSMPVIPDAPPRIAVSSAGFYAARDRAASLFDAHRSAILETLCVPERLNRKSHPAEQITTLWANELAALARAEPLQLPACVAKLTESALRKATRVRQVEPSHPFFTALTELEHADAVIRAQFDDHVLALRRAMVDYARSQVGARRRKLGVQSFDDLLFQLQRALLAPEGAALAARIAARHPAALIDEFQDTDPVQYDVFRRIYAGAAGGLFLIGDPKQAIYGFRGADVFAYMRAAQQAGSAAYTLDVNHRSDPRLVHAVNCLFEQARLPFLFPEIRFEPVRPAPRARPHMDAMRPALQLLFLSRTLADDGSGKKSIAKGWAERHLPRLLAGEIAGLLASGECVGEDPVQPRHMAVLCRTNAQARETARELGRLGIPSVLDGDSSVFETEMAEELSRVLFAVARPLDARRLGAALSSSILGVSGEALYSMRSDEAALEPWLERLASWNTTWHERGFIQMWHQLLEDAGVRSRLLGWTDGERRLTNLLHLSELLHRAAAAQHLGPLSLLHWFTQMRADPQQRGTLVAESAQLRLEHDEHALKLTTIHRSKGLEYPIVFCPFLWADPPLDGKDVCFHDRQDADRLKLDLGSPDHARHAQLAQREALAESLRLLYVALTRARHRCYVVWGRFNRAGRSPLGYLLHQSASDGEPALDAVDKHLDTLSDEQMRAELQRLCDRSEGAIGCAPLTPSQPQAYVATERAQGQLAARVATRTLQQGPRMSSFSRLTALTARDPALPAEERFALDEDSELDAVVQAAAAGLAPALALHEFPAGSGPGSLIHTIYEHIDFQRGDPGELEAQVRRALRAHGLSETRFAEPLGRAIDQTLRTPLDEAKPPLTLARLARADRRVELEFTLSTAAAEDASLAPRLAAVFERHAAPASAPSYPARLRRLGQLPQAAFLKGFIDLVFRHQQRFYIVDYKSNRLGDSARDYRGAKLIKSMQEHHYFLQYHLYALALHRHLQLRLPDYSFERCFGGVYYLFMRGMAPEHAPGTGIFFDRPALAMLEELAVALGAQVPGP